MHEPLRHLKGDRKNTDRRRWPFSIFFPFLSADLLYPGSCAHEEFRVITHPRGPLGSGGALPSGRAARGKSGACPRQCPWPRPGLGASEGGRARQGLREALSRAPSACQKPPAPLRSAAASPLPPACPREEATPGSASRHPPAPGFTSRGKERPLRSPRAAAPRVSAGPAGRGGAAGLRPLPPRPLPAVPRRLRPPASARPGPRRPRCPEDAGGGCGGGWRPRQERAPVLLENLPGRY